ncbi:MAG: DUF3093 domain-containing protein [Gordonia sp. (in: high G+C Gram-positive bacteria)]
MSADPDEAGSDPATPESEPVADGADPAAEDAAPAAESEPTAPGAVLFSEPGGSWWVVAIGPVLIIAVLVMEISGPGQVHWPVITIFGAIVVGFSIIQVIAARRHVSVELTETALRQGTRVVPLAEIARIFPESRGGEPQDWQSAPALGELHGVPRRRTGVGVKLADGTLRQAWARDVERFRTELTEAHLAVQLGLPPRGE